MFADQNPMFTVSNSMIRDDMAEHRARLAEHSSGADQDLRAWRSNSTGEKVDVRESSNHHHGHHGLDEVMDVAVHAMHSVEHAVEHGLQSMEHAVEHAVEHGRIGKSKGKGKGHHLQKMGREDEESASL